jgi:hypothetical protein
MLSHHRSGGAVGKSFQLVCLVFESAGENSGNDRLALLFRLKPFFEGLLLSFNILAVSRDLVIQIFNSRPDRL